MQRRHRPLSALPVFALRGSRSGVLPDWLAGACWRPRLSLLGFCGIVALAVRRVPGAARIGMLGVAVAGLVLGVSEWQGIASLPPDPTPTLLALDIAGALQAGMAAVILTFLIVDLFDTTGRS